MVSGRGTTVTTYFDGDTRGLARAVDNATRSLGQFTRTSGVSFARITGAFALGNLAASTIQEGARQMAAQLRLSVDQASALNETLNKSREVFGNASAAMEEWGSGAASSVGLSQRAAVDAASTFGNMFVQLGLGQDEAAALSRQMVQLGADFASFHNADISEVIAAQTSAFRGEYDAVQRFVPTINAAAVQQKAMEMGLAASTNQLTMQDKALATHRLLVDGAGSATGDFARTSGDAANQQRILAANIETLQGKVGQALLPVLRDVVAAMNDWIDSNGDQFAKDLGEAIDGAAEALGGLYKTLQDIRDSSPYKAVIQFTDGEGNLLTAAALVAMGFKVGGPAIGVPMAIGAGVFGLTQQESREGGALGRRPVTPAGMPVPTRIQAGATQPAALTSDLVNRLRDFNWADEMESQIFGGLFEQKAARGAGKAGTGEAPVFDAGKALSGLARSAEDAKSRMDEAFELTQIRDLNLAHKMMEEAELAAAAAVKVHAEAEAALAEQQRGYISFLSGLGQRNVRFAPGVFESIAHAGGLKTIGDFESITDGSGNPIPRVDIVVP